jgi:hypothetical protein
MASTSNQIIGNALIPQSFYSTKFGIIIREVSYLDGFTINRDHSKFKHLAAFYGNSFGEKLAFMTFCPKKGVVYVLETLIPCDALPTYLLFDMFKRMSGISAISVMKSIRNYEFIESIFKEPVSALIGDSICEKLGDELGRMYEKSLLSYQNPRLVPEYPLTITFTMIYKPLLAGVGKEIPHGVYLYPSLSFAKGTPYFVSYKEADGRTMHSMTFYTRKRHIGPFAMLNIDAQALFSNQNDVFCQNQAGYSNLRLTDALSRINRRIESTLFVPNSDVKKPKGTTMLVFSSITIDGKPPLPAPDDSLGIDQVRGDLIKTSKRVVDYIKRNRAFYHQYPATSTSIQNITVFCYDGRKGQIPGCMFDSFKIPPSRETYYLNALKYAIQRRTVSEAKLQRDGDSVSWGTEIDLNRWTEGRPQGWCAAVVMDMLCIYANWCNYITDIVDYNEAGAAYKESLRKLIESFDVIRCRDCGDCEDFTREILMSAMELLFNKAYFKSEAIKHVQSIMDRFIFVSVLCGVSKASISFTERNEKTMKLSGHECALAVPKYIFFKALSRSDPNHPLLSFHTIEERDKGKEDQIYVLEGTGNLFPEPKEQSQRYKTLLESVFEEFPEEITASVRKQFFYHPKKEDNFYKKFITFLTPEFFLRFGYRGFEFLVCVEDKNEPGQFLRGVDFLSFLEIDKNKSIRLIEAPQIPVKTFRDASRLDDDNFPPMSIEPVDISMEMKKVAQSFTVLQPDAFIPQNIDDILSFQIPIENVNQTFIELWKKEVNAKRLNMFCQPEAVKLNHSTKRIIGGYTIYIF